MNRDDVIVGGGVIGLSIAYELARAGRSVVVLERERPGAGATHVAGGMLAPISEAELEEPELLELGRDSLQRYPEFVESVQRTAGGMSCGYRTEGTLWIATTRDERAELEHLASTVERRGLSVQPIGVETLREREPHLSGRVLAALRVEQDHQVDPRRLSAALAAAIEAQGGRVLDHTTVREIVVERDAVRGVRAVGDDGKTVEVEAREVVLAAGAWSEQELESPLEPLTLRPVKGQLLRLHGPPLLTHVVRAPEVYLVPREDGELLVGATMEEMGYDTTVTAGAVLDLLRHAWEALPGVYDLELRETCVGLRSATEDHLPLIGATGIDGLHLAVGHYRSGVLLAPATAHHLARLIVEGGEPEELRPFRPARLRSGV